MHGDVCKFVKGGLWHTYVQWVLKVNTNIVEPALE